MTESPADLPSDRLRASDADRERVAGALHEAAGAGRLTIAEVDERLKQVYAAKTLGELRPITRDLPGYGQIAAPVERVTSPASVARSAGVGQTSERITGGPASGSAVAVLSGASRSGTWTVPETFHVVAVMGGVELDLTQATFGAPDVTIQVFALMGGVEIIVPDDVVVDSHAFAFMGGIDDKSRNDAPAGSPVVHVTGFALMGGVEIGPPKRRQLGRR